MTALCSSTDNVQIVPSGDGSTLLPRVHRGVLQTKISGEVFNGRPYVEDLLHSSAIRILRIIVNTPMRDCESENCVVGFP